MIQNQFITHYGQLCCVWTEFLIDIFDRFEHPPGTMPNSYVLVNLLVMRFVKH